MEELRLLFLLLGGCAIVGILAHGMWSVRKNKEQGEKQSLEPRDWSIDEDVEDDEIVINADFELPEDAPFTAEPAVSGQYDDLGLGEVRVVSAEKTSTEPTGDDDEQTVHSTEIEANESNAAVEETAEPVETETQTQPSPKIYSSVVTQPKPEFAAEQLQAVRSKTTLTGTSPEEVPEPPPFLLKQDNEELASDKRQEPVAKDIASAEREPKQTEPVKSQEKISLAEQARNLVKRKKAETKPRKRKEPKVGDDQMKIDFDEPEPEVKVEASSEEEPNASSAAQQEVLVLNVKAPTDAPIQGAALLPMLLTLGFKFGDQDIFHRHVNSNGKGPVLFSLANMFKPGNFDIDNLENFTTQGVSLFMILPIEGDPHQVFNMMHNAARKIADEFNGTVLDGRRSALNKQSLQQYVEKIREFERLRMIAR